jgi:hypothetical protein
MPAMLRRQRAGGETHSGCPFPTQQLGLLQHRPRGLLLLVGRVAMSSEDALYRHPKLGPRRFLQGPVNRDVMPNRLDKFPRD